MRTAIGLLAVVFACGAAFGQLTPDEAAKRLAEKQAARQAERSALVSITKGELDDLRAEVASLKLQLAQAKASTAQQATPAAAAVKLVPKLAVGNTREEVTRFVQVHKAQYEIKSDLPDSIPVAGRPASGGATMVIEVKAKRKVYTGTSSNGVSRTAVYHEEMRPDATLTLKMVNGVVASISENKMDTRPDENEFSVR